MNQFDEAYFDAGINRVGTHCAKWDEMRREKPRAVITGTDLAARKFVPEGEVAFAVTGPEFEKMLAVTEECFFHSPVWKPVRNRLRSDEHLEDVKFTGLA